MTKHFDAFIEDLDRLRKCYDIVYSIFIELGPYTTKLPAIIRQQINDIMEFDDSE